MKHYPVQLYNSSFRGHGAWHECTGSFGGYGELSQYGRQLAISPKKFYGFPGDKWEGEWTERGMASLLIHLALTVNLRRLRCLEDIGSYGG
jgi:hypothetical protein